MVKFISKSKSCYKLASGLTQVSLFTPLPLQVNLTFLTKNHFTRENPLWGDANGSLHLAVIYYVSNEQMMCLITVL